MIHYLKPNLLHQAIKVYLVGAGGTGSHVLRRLANMHIALLGLGHQYGLDVTVIDPDVVSPTNVGRQNFYPCDVGQPKAAILVNRCNLQMMTNWKSIQARIDHTCHYHNIDLVIGCIDNRKGRDDIIKGMESSVYEPTYYLDIGNRSHDGQVILGQVKPKRSKEPEFRLPHVGELLPEIIDVSLDDVDDMPSCSLAEALEKQSLFINDAMANAAINILWELLRHGCIRFHGQFINLKSGRSTPLAVDPEAWKRLGFDPKIKPEKKPGKKLKKPR